MALITMLDSAPAVADLPRLVPHLRNVALPFVAVDRDVLVDIPTLVQLIQDQKHDWLAGFDELWLCSSRPPHGKPDNVRITSDQPLEREPVGLAAWMINATCFLGLGDGDGLNFATFDGTLADLLGACRA